jgi:cytochrome P450
VRDDGRPTFFSSFHGGFSVLTRYEDIRAAFLDAELFPQWGRGIPENPFDRVFIPLNLDPPEHRPYRRLMVPLFSPGRVAKLDPIVRGVARDRIAELAERDGCEFVHDFALVLPGANFCGMLGLPVSEFANFNRMAMDLIYAPALVRKEQGDDAAKAAQRAASQKIEAFIGDLVARRQRERSDDVISALLDSQVDGRPLTVEEVHNITNLLFFAGTDSTAAMIAYAFAFLAEHPDHRRWIIENPDRVGAAVDELIRFHGFHHITRVASRDAEFAGCR